MWQSLGDFDFFILHTYPWYLQKVALKKAVEKIDEQAYKEMSVKMNTAYFIAKDELPFTKFPGLLQLQQKNGIQITNTWHKVCRNGCNRGHTDKRGNCWKPLKWSALHFSHDWWSHRCLQHRKQNCVSEMFGYWWSTSQSHGRTQTCRACPCWW